MDRRALFPDANSGETDAGLDDVGPARGGEQREDGDAGVHLGDLNVMLVRAALNRARLAQASGSGVRAIVDVHARVELMSSKR
jgi:hypothetical protein